MKRIIPLCLLAIALAGVARGQAVRSLVEFTYDESGNRLSITVIYLNNSYNTPLKSATDSAAIVAEDLNDAETPAPDVSNLLDMELRLYPNPTRGELVLEVGNATAEQLQHQGNSLVVTSMQGKMLARQDRVRTSNIINLIGQKAGEYMVVLVLAGEKKVYKVIKE